MSMLRGAVGLLLVVLGVQGRAAPPSDPDPFVARLLAAFPQPTGNEFPSPTSVVDGYFAALNANDLSGALRCFPMRESLAAWTVDASVAHTEVFDLLRGPALPGVDALDWLRYQFDGFRRSWAKLRRLALVASHPELETLMGRDYTFSSAVPDWSERLDAVKRMRVTALYRVAVTRVQDMQPDPLEKGLGVTDKKLLALDIDLGDRSVGLEPLFTVGRIGSSWRILFMQGL